MHWIGWFLFCLFVVIVTLEIMERTKPKQWVVRADPLNSDDLSLSLQEGWKPISCFQNGGWTYIVLTKRVKV